MAFEPPGSTASYRIRIKSALVFETVGGSPLSLLTVNIERAPDSAGSPATSSIERIAKLRALIPSTYVEYDDILPNDDARRHYRSYVSRSGYTDSAKTGWVSAKPAETLL